MPTPLQTQYSTIKAKYPDAIVFFRLGDFYEMFNQDALIASKVLNITLTARHKKSEHRMDMCGVPYHSATSYIARLTKAGFKVAICEQLSDPSLKGLVKRDVIRVITPGTTFDENVLDPHQPQYVLSVVQGIQGYGIALADLTVGEFKVTTLATLNDLKAEITKWSPREAIMPQNVFDDQLLQNIFKSHQISVYPYTITRPAPAILLEHFKVQTLNSFGLESFPHIVDAAALLIQYLQDTQKNAVAHLNKLNFYHPHQVMFLDEITLRNLEIITNQHTGQTPGSLLSIVDHTKTPMGSRLLRKWLINPLIEIEAIVKRQDAIAEIVQDTPKRLNFLNILNGIHDFARTISKINNGLGHPKDYIHLKNSLNQIPALQNILNQCTGALLKKLNLTLQPLPELITTITQTVVEDPPLRLGEGYTIKSNLNAQLDHLRKLCFDGKSWLQTLQQQEQKRTGINSLKVRYNRIFGYYIEISKANLAAVPPDYERKQTLVNAERFVTPALKEYEKQILSAEENILTLETQILNELKDKTIGYTQTILKNANLIATLDVIVNLAQLAVDERYVRPVFKAGNQLVIKEGRHPVLEKFQTAPKFIPNDLILNQQDQQIMLITGPNMGGKSTYLRQNALLILLAQTGSFIPAAQAELCIVDRIFTRIGAADNLLQGQSTFMVEMQETANILNHATPNSLIILDEIGRGTSTYDGLSLAWALVGYLHHQIKAKTIFATHYHELIELIKTLPRAKNHSVAVSENQQGILFLYKVVTGGIDRSYGIEVAKLAGLPASVITKAQIVLNQLEKNTLLKNKPTSDSANHQQQSLFPKIKDDNALIIEAIKKIDPNALTPLQALQTLVDLKHQIP